MSFLPEAPVIMGVINVTPDSFSDGGLYETTEKAIKHGMRLISEGAQILDIGGESTRPGATPISPHEEQERILPVIEGLWGCGALLSVDTRHASTMLAAVGAGADIINDVTALTGDPESLHTTASSGAAVCLMHMKGDPGTMQDNPAYDNVVEEVFDYLQERINACVEAGISKDRLMVDPGIGFGKTLTHNLTLLKNLDRFNDLDVPVMLGVSRKSFIGALDWNAEPEERLPGSLAAAVSGLEKGVSIFRVHDVAETRQALAVAQAIRE